jgi:hypothetical protein
MRSLAGGGIKIPYNPPARGIQFERIVLNVPFGSKLAIKIPKIRSNSISEEEIPEN